MRMRNIEERRDPDGGSVRGDKIRKIGQIIEGHKK
jgi:hypothetical protein